MARDIEEFLRRAAERRKQQQQKKQQPPPEQTRRVREIIEQQNVEVVEPEIVYAEEIKPAPKPRRKKPNPGRLAKKKDMRNQSVSEHVRSHIDSTDIASHAEHLGDRIQNIDDKVAARISNKFDHDVGRLDDMPSVQDDKVAGVTRDEVSQIVSDLVSMLRSPKSIRQAIMISEILKRPSFDD